MRVSAYLKDEACNLAGGDHAKRAMALAFKAKSGPEYLCPACHLAGRTVALTPFQHYDPRNYAGYCCCSEHLHCFAIRR